MAGPAITTNTLPLWDPYAHTLTISWDAVLTAVAGLPTDIQLTDADGVLWAGPGNVVGSHTLTLYPAGTPGTASTVDIAAAAFVSAGGDSLAITDSLYNLTLNRTVAQAPFTKTDLDALYTVLHSIMLAGDLSGLDTLQRTDLSGFIDRLLKTATSNTQGLLLQTPRISTQANAMLTQYDKFVASSKDQFAFRDLDQTVKVLRAAMPKGGQAFPFAITSNGL